ncbi:MAG: histone deacetylase [Cyclobacteriaceae bacterium]|nr:histone deacetylase [Cyclobacteriaceae bacterium]
MNFIFVPACLGHQTGAHPECPQRLQKFEHLPPSDTAFGLDYVPLVHTAAHIEQVRSACNHERPLDNDTLTSVGSYAAALAGVGASITAADQGDFALIRPPGHHAYPHKSTGFCLFNNIAIAVKHLQRQGKRVMILDFDGHLGDGTSHIFYEDPNVLFCSIHQFPAFPGHGWIDEIGSGPGKGFTVNIPLPPGAGDDLFWQGMELIGHIGHQFQPDVVAVSAGFDGYREDPLLQLQYSLQAFYRCGQWLRENFDRVFAVLEGGYNLSMLPLAIHNFVNGFNSKPPEQSEEPTTTSPLLVQKTLKDLASLKKCLIPYWSLDTA